MFIRPSFVQLYDASLLKRAVRDQRPHQGIVNFVDEPVPQGADVPPDLDARRILIRISHDRVERKPRDDPDRQAGAERDRTVDLPWVCGFAL